LVTSLWKVILGHRRVFVALAVAITVYALFPVDTSAGMRAIVAWDAGVVGLLLLTFRLFLNSDPTRMPALAEAQEDGQWTIFWILLLASVASFSAVTTEFAGLKDMPAGQRLARIVLVASTLMMSWLLAHVVFAVRYAHEWYRREETGTVRRGLDFPGDSEPDYMDFLYFSLVLGMTFQVSDVQITARGFRRLAMLHGLVSFLYNTIIIALTVNIAAGLL
jgi:uncharacterized membrane protein